MMVQNISIVRNNKKYKHIIELANNIGQVTSLKTSFQPSKPAKNHFHPLNPFKAGNSDLKALSR